MNRATLLVSCWWLVFSCCLCFAGELLEAQSLPEELLNSSISTSNSNQVGNDDEAKSLGTFDVHPELKLSAFAAEPQLANPTNMDIDHLGRVWVCEAVNYRRFRNGDMPLRKEGDRVIVLEDTDRDGRADKSTTFYQDPSINSPHGICVLGNRVILSVRDSVLVLTDSDGDLVADKKEVLFTGIGGVEHDHGIHAFVFGPDGKLYFNFGNEGKQIRDRDGNPIVDQAGNVVETRRPYQNGMVFRCNLDGSEFETLAWNFRNNWEVCVDSFGRIWQSDNDDDGNRATRINFVIPYGNYGFSDERTGAGWRATRTGQAAEIPLRHWHLNDPGVVPNLLQTGAGSPTGICIYEGRLLPSTLHGQMIHCDAGPNIVRAYPVTHEGAGFSATIVNLLDGARNNQWFRPSDVCVAPDGSVFIADWFDPGVGGHRMQDAHGGRLYRLLPKTSTSEYVVERPDFKTIEGTLAAFRSPNQATRFLAWERLDEFGEEAIEPLLQMARSGPGFLRARALWYLSKKHSTDIRAAKLLLKTATGENPELRATMVRIASQIPNKKLGDQVWQSMEPDDASPAVRRELLIAMRHPGGKKFDVADWARLAMQYRPGDRWYLESLGIAADGGSGRWDQCLEELRMLGTWSLDDQAVQDIVWRSRGNGTAALLCDLILNPQTSGQATLRYFRSLDFCRADVVRPLARRLAFENKIADREKLKTVITESLSRVGEISLTDVERMRLRKFVGQLYGTSEYVDLVKQFELESEYLRLFEISLTQPGSQLSVDAMIALFQLRQVPLLQRQLQKFATSDEAKYLALLKSMAATGRKPAATVIGRLVDNSTLELERRRQAVLAMGKLYPGAQQLLGMAEARKIDPQLEPAVIAALFNSSSDEIRGRARTCFPESAQMGGRAIPTIEALAKLKASSSRGSAVFMTEASQCANCHVVNGTGKAVGPDLSEIGTKLSRQAMFESILYPSAGISHGYENWSILTVDGQLLSGLVVEETDDRIVVQDKDGLKRTVARDDIDEKKLQILSLMPDGLHKDLTDQQLADLVAYLMTLKRSGN